ncbi:tyrosine-type recombinase/integrase [Escherichia coli]|nr:tyrosine-type recombinase/integrase [Escherichia coli]
MKKAKVATIEEVKLIAETLDAESHKRGNELFTDVADVWRIGFYTARRVSDIIGMKWDDIKDGVWTLTEQKTGKVIHLPLPEKMLAILNKRRGGGSERKPVQGGWVFPSRKFSGKHVSRQAVENALLRVREILTARGELSGECLSMHSTRKASATIVYRSTKDVLKAMKFLNHSKPETTLKYLELNDAVDDALSITGGFSL